MSSTAIAVEVLRTRLHDAYRRMGVSEEEAVVGAELCLEAELLGRVTHGVRLIGNIRLEYANGAARRRPLRVERETAVSAVVDGGFHLSLYVHDAAARLARKKALEAGIAIVAVTNAGVSGALGIHASRISSSELVALALNSSPSVVVPPGTASPLMGSNPVAIAVPRSGPQPLVIDMATSAMAFNAVRVAMAAGQTLPDDVAVDADARTTNNPSEAVDEHGRGRLLPFGAHRGYSLALAIELLTAGATGGALGAAKIGPAIAEPSHFPGVYIAYRADLFDDADAFALRTERFLTEVDAAGGHIPGDERARRRDKAIEQGHLLVDTDYLDLLDADR